MASREAARKRALSDVLLLFLLPSHRLQGFSRGLRLRKATPYLKNGVRTAAAPPTIANRLVSTFLRTHLLHVTVRSFGLSSENLQTPDKRVPTHASCGRDFEYDFPSVFASHREPCRPTLSHGTRCGRPPSLSLARAHIF